MHQLMLIFGTRNISLAALLLTTVRWLISRTDHNLKKIRMFPWVFRKFDRIARVGS